MTCPRIRHILALSFCCKWLKSAIDKMQLGTVNTGVVHTISGLSREAVGYEDRQRLVKFLSHDLGICDGDQLTFATCIQSYPGSRRKQPPLRLLYEQPSQLVGGHQLLTPHLYSTYNTFEVGIRHKSTALFVDPA